VWVKLPVEVLTKQFPIHPHLLFETLAYLIAFQAYRFLRNRYGDSVSISSRWSVIAAAAVGAALGSKVLFLAEDPTLTLAHIHDPAFLMGGKTVVGGLIGGLIGVELTKKIAGIQERTGDLFAVPLCIGIAVGRIGCFLSGLADNTYGTATSLPWGVDFGDGISRHPVQIYEAAFVLLLGFFLHRRFRCPHVSGDVFKAFMVGYATFRVLVDFLKPYPRFGGLCTIQWACAALLLYYLPDVARWLRSRSGSARLHFELQGSTDG
jgi:phosphatidylglycerol:prolipoprotein diacylglycerol transferase